MYRTLKLEPVCKYCKQYINGNCVETGASVNVNSHCLIEAGHAMGFTPVIKFADINPICKNCDICHNGYLCEGCGKYTSENDKCMYAMGSVMGFVPSNMAIDAAIAKARQR